MLPVDNQVFSGGLGLAAMGVALTALRRAGAWIR